ncbi:hypothetical protein QTP88_027808 [Uroleucon formosanum]
MIIGQMFEEKLSSEPFASRLRGWQTASISMVSDGVDFNAPRMDLIQEVCSWLSLQRELSKLLKSKKSGAGANDIYKPALRWFEQADTFLRPVTEARPSKSNLVSINLVFKFFLNSKGE